MKKYFITFFAFMATVLACSCEPKPAVPDDPGQKDDPETPVFSLNSYNGAYMKALAGACDYFEENGSLPASITVDGLRAIKGEYVLAACQLIVKIVAEPDTWQETDINPTPPAMGSEYRWNTYDYDTIDWAHIQFLAGRIAAYAETNKSLPNYVTFPSDDPSSPGYLPQLTMVVTKHDNLMNIGAYPVVLLRTIKYFVENEGKWPDEVSAWPASFLDSVRNCPTDDPLVQSTLKEILSTLPSDATQRQKAEAIFTFALEEWEWENYSNTSRGAVRTITDKLGNCCDLTHATLALCRAAGIPARYLHGQCYFQSGVIGHVIPEIYVDGKWWICDPSNNNATFGTPTWQGMETFNGRYNELEF